MMNLKILSERRSGLIPNLLVGAVGVIAFIGFIDASYLTAKRFAGSALNCYFFGGCDAVNASPYSVLLGLPLSLYGSVFYLLVILSAVAYIQTKENKVIFTYALMFLTTMGVIFSGYFIFLQQFVIKAYCFYCVISAVTSTTNFILMLYGWKRYFVKIKSPIANEAPTV